MGSELTYCPFVTACLLQPVCYCLFITPFHYPLCKLTAGKHSQYQTVIRIS